MESKVTFGRRRATVKAPLLLDSADSRLNSEQRNAIRKVLWASPVIAILVALPIVIAKLPSAGCRSKPAAERGVFDINWCHAGLAAVRGAAQGVAVGAGRAR